MKLDFVCLTRSYNDRYGQVEFKFRKVKHLTKDCISLAGKSVLEFSDTGEIGFRVCRLCQEVVEGKEVAEGMRVKAEERKKELSEVKKVKEAFFKRAPKFFTTARRSDNGVSIFGTKFHTQKYCPALSKAEDFIALTDEETKKMARCRNCVDWEAYIKEQQK